MASETSNYGDNEDLIQVDINFKGSKIKVYKSKSIGYYICPVCKKSIFFNELDLLDHIIAHAKGLNEKRRDIPTRFYRREKEE
ncbi:MAG: hypothetical protein ACP5I6_07835 [Caldisphaera sp.]|nr:MAG: hypothetical protein C0201_00625 [Caldisphaera sp.]PMP90859.1 MAG: hypothetical protein C0171_04205 [Caldisphaera sp.]